MVAVCWSNWRASTNLQDLSELDGSIVGHFDAVRVTDDALWLGEASQPVAGQWPVIRADTSTHVDLDALCIDIEALTKRG
jgi:hypothetical protein